MLGSIYYQGKLINQDYTKALTYLLKAAESNDNSAEFLLGYMYEKGHGVEKDKVKAKEWYERSKAHGNKTAELMINLLFLS